MPDVTVNLGDTPIKLPDTSDLVKFAEQQLPIAFTILDSDIVKFKDRPLSDVPVDSGKSLSASLKVAQDAKWNVGGSGKLSIGFTADAAGSISVIRSGELFSYSVSDDEADDVKVVVPSGFAYLKINLNVSFGLSAGAEFSHGAFGVSGAIDSSVKFNLSNYKCFPETTLVSDAVKQSFERFALPFHADGFADALQNNDFLEYEFIGKLGLTLGVSYGLTSLLLGGRSLGEIKESIESTVGKVVVNVKPSLDAKAEFGIDYEYLDAFRVVIGRHKQGNSDTNSLFLSKLEKKTLTISFDVVFKASLGASFNIESRLDTIIDNAAQSLFKNLPAGPVKDAAIAAFKENLKKEEHKRELDKYIQEANEQINGLLKQLDNKKIALGVLHESIDSRKMLFNYTFDLNVANALAQGFPLAVAGDFRDALRVDGVSLLPGSYIESLFIRRTTLSFQLFDLFHVFSTTEYFKKMSLVYAGKGVFKYRFTTGVKHEDGFVGHERAVEVFFTADASTIDFQNLSGVNVKLNFILNDHANRRAARQTLGIMQFTGGGIELQNLAARLRETLEKDASLHVKLSCSFDQNAYGRLLSDDFDQHGKPHQLPQPFDQANWEAFVRSVDDLTTGAGFNGEGFPNRVARFGDWVRYNRVANDSETSTKPPNRLHRGNANTDSVWPDAWRERDSLTDRRFLVVYLEAGRGFMNLADDLKHLAMDQDTVTTQDHWEDLVKFLNAMIKDGQRDDIQVWFVKPALLALLRLTQGRVVDVKGPLSGETIDKTFEVAFEVTA